MIYKFTDTTYTIDSLKNTEYYSMLEYYRDGGVYNNNIPSHNYKVSYIDTTLSRLTVELLNTGIKKIMGWVIDYREVWNKYLIKLKYHGWVEVYSPSKMAIRDVYGNNNILDKIIKL